MTTAAADTPFDAIAPTSTAAGTEPLPLPTRRQWAADRGLCLSLEETKKGGKRGGGRLPNAAKDRIAAELAKPDGQRFSD